jgi:uncharacterized phage protein (TIGR01671 family)
MRELRFRAWDKAEKCLVYNPLNSPEEYPLNECEQFTGLRDRNGVEVFEGDVISIENAMGKKSIGIVEFTDGCFDVRIKDSFIFGRMRDYLKCFTINRAAEVIGNVHENSELLDVIEEAPLLKKIRDRFNINAKRRVL